MPRGEGPDIQAIYTVKENDTLYTIAKQYALTVEQLLEANSDLIKDPEHIEVGWVLNIP
ncbi:LysM peptidoglycan-binding domain-containing protein [Nostoc sp.]|uniref:LysM peptidoglycan-binding domain-containing protein n=1 Tax=Nostoc sp. TaxID=1180 RepID=UPI002FF7F7A4